jgi:RNA polymerase sigma-70 factor (ECF subfamily)
MKGKVELPDWFESFKKGHGPSFDKVFSANHRALYYHAFTLLANKLDAEEVVSDVFCALWDERDSIKSPEHLVNWLYLVSQRKCLAVLKRPKMVRLEAVEDPASVDEVQLRYAIIEAEQIRLMEQQIAELPAKIREVFLLRYVRGMDAPTTAKTLKVDIQIIYLYSQRALEKLRLKLSNLNLETAVLYLLPLIISFL